jgi:hypothetical protein
LTPETLDVKGLLDDWIRKRGMGATRILILMRSPDSDKLRVGVVG